MTQERPSSQETPQTQEPHTIVIVVEDGTVDWIYTDLNVRVIVVEPSLIPDGLCEQIRQTPALQLKDLDLPAYLKRKVRSLMAPRETTGALVL
jgi:hypothetical protein